MTEGKDGVHSKPEDGLSIPTEGRLLPCPFCGTTAHVVAWPREHENRMVAKIECFTDDCYAVIYAATPSAVVKAWNRRA
jgi:hypothetical protein